MCRGQWESCVCHGAENWNPKESSQKINVLFGSKNHNPTVKPLRGQYYTALMTVARDLSVTAAEKCTAKECIFSRQM
jgi:hypothetical protein